MSAGPDVVRIKRKRSAPAPDTLVVESSKRAYTERIHYIRKKEDGEEELALPASGPRLPQPQQRHTSEEERNAGSGITNLGGLAIPAVNVPMSPVPRDGQVARQPRRVFHLRRSAQTHESSGRSDSKKRKAEDDDIATFVESKHSRLGANRGPTAASSSNATAAPAPGTFKRPGKNSAIRDKDRVPLTTLFAAPSSGTASTRTQEAATAQYQQIADSLHQFALDEAAKDDTKTPMSPSTAKPHVTSLPKLSAERSRELHRQRTSSRSLQGPPPDATATAQFPTDTLMDLDPDADPDADSDSGEYVFDTYVLAPPPSTHPSTIPRHLNPSPIPPSSIPTPTSDDIDDPSIGYLIITDSDLPTWEFYTDHPDHPDSDLGAADADDDDENAEDWYGADYPDDEVASDDEFGRNVYRFRDRGRNSDDEEWGIAGGSGGGSNSDGEEDGMSWSDQEDERMRNPFQVRRTARQFAKYLEKTRAGGEGAERGGEGL